MRVGKSILDIRKSRGMSQEQFGRLFHVTRQTVSNWENEKSYPDLQTLIEISDRFAVSLDHLIKEDERMAKVIDKERKSARAGRIIIGVLTIVLIIAFIGMKRLMNAFEAMPNEQRNRSYTSAMMWLDFPDATPSRAIIRTFNREDYEAYSVRQLARIRDEIGGAVEGDMPFFHKQGEGIIRLIFQTAGMENVIPDQEPHIVIKEYAETSVLPEYDVSQEGEIRELGIDLRRDEQGYYFSFSDEKEQVGGREISVCMLEVFYTVDEKEYASVSAFYIK